MKNSKVLKTILIISGLLASGVGAAILFTPVAFYAAYATVLDADFGLFNEIRASGGGLLASGIVILSGAFVAKLAFTSIVISTALYLPYGFSRVLSIAIDGMPAEGFVQAAALEIVLGLVCAFALVKYQEKQHEIA